MERQLVLLEADPAQWKLDDTTRRIGKSGVAKARAAMQAAARKAATRAPESGNGRATAA